MALFNKEDAKGLILLIPILFIAGALLLIYAKLTEDDILDIVRERESEYSITMSEFNPNTFEYEDLRRAGLPADIAASIVRWRRYGKVYRMKEDIALVNGVTDSIYAILKPYIIIDDSLTIKPMYREFDSVPKPRYRDFRRDTIPLTRFCVDTATVEYLSHIGFSERQAEVFVQYRDMIGGIFNEEQLRRCYVVSDSMAMRLLPHIIFSQQVETAVEDGPLDINSADTTALIAVYGIGSKSAIDIVNYRELLGGYYSVEQLAEIKSITESNFDKILSQICCDSCKISKIDINFASPKEFEKHPYISSRALRRIVKQRQLKGGWSRIEEMVQQEIFTEEEAERLAPYLRFRLDTSINQ